LSAPDDRDFDRLAPGIRGVLVRELAVKVLGESKGAAVADRLEPGIRSRARQLGDAAEPEQNFWKGAWRIHELEGEGDPDD